jgi:glycosyltransferase involved in cell wall biosynthesis
LNWKRVDTLVKAAVRLLKDNVAIHVNVVGYGPEEKKLRRLAGRYLIADADRSEILPGIVFGKPVPIAQVRNLMRRADVVVLSSDGGEGWGAVVNEAMSEGCCVIGTREAGSSATMIEHGVNGLLYRAGHTAALANLFTQCEEATRRAAGRQARRTVEMGWSPAHAAGRLVEFVRQQMAAGGAN